MESKLRVEYACTPAEISEAQNLALTSQIAKGPAWLSKLILGFILIGIILAAYFQALQFSPQHPVYCGIGLALLFAIIFIIQSRSRNKTPPPDIVTFTPAEVTINSHTGQTVFPWSTFSHILETESLLIFKHRSGIMIYVFPKRAFPDSASVDWLRSLANEKIHATVQEQSDPVDAPVTGRERISATGDGIALQFTLRYRDYLDRALASWLTLGIMVLMGGVILFAFVTASLEPAPGAVFTTAEVCIYFGLPMFLFMESVIFIVVGTKMWLMHRSCLVEQTVTITDKGIMNDSAIGSTAQSWEQHAQFKETRWSFIVWWPGTQMWLMLPKRAFASDNEVQHCRKILTQNAQYSRWFF